MFTSTAPTKTYAYLHTLSLPVALPTFLSHKVGDPRANLTFRLLFDDLRFTNDEIAAYDVGVGFWAYLVGIFVGGWLYSRIGMKRSVLLSLVLMMLSNQIGRAHV